ncbi:MAG: prepilin-type N-terminal cleavage/methylation domain-containing protein [Planctomycetes bacterium]|nr:prepilin-type N-terminal cleavage/methylation domain-containing protein [Planctomycetota bacterium]
MTRRGGFTLVEVMVSLVIMAGAVTASLAAVGMASEDVIDTVDQRKMRYLIQNLLGDIEKGRALPDDLEAEEFYEEGMQGDFIDYASPDDPSEFDGYQWYIPVFRDEVIAGAPDEDTLLDMGFVTDDGGNVTGRPVSNDFPPGEFGLEGEAGSTGPPGQVKRVLVFVVRRLGETAEEDREFTVMTYLPYPGEEDQTLGEGGEGGEGGPGSGAAGAASSPTRDSGSGSRNTSSGTDRK